MPESFLIKLNFAKFLRIFFYRKIYKNTSFTENLWATASVRINSLILSSFPLTSFHLADASLYYLYYCVCSCPKNDEMSFIYIVIHIFSTHFAINLFYLHNLKT